MRTRADSELSFDYMFDSSGKLAGMKGSVSVRTIGPTLPGETEPPLFADWVGEADLLPGSDGKIPPQRQFEIGGIVGRQPM